jgi:hypothetical protein
MAQAIRLLGDCVLAAGKPGRYAGNPGIPWGMPGFSTTVSPGRGPVPTLVG